MDQLTARLLTQHSISADFFESHDAGVFFLAGPLGEQLIKFRTPRLEPTSARAAGLGRRIECCDHHVVVRFPGFGQCLAVRSEDHRVSGSDFVIVDADAVTED